ncbi:MAG: Ig-like domain-containing protein [Luteolibacter sp.]|uniref:Ig-like domain-containing protein n=1 Tax=Luteolibacter sp. TaxID=1962973 RepID=UPI00326585F8
MALIFACLLAVLLGIVSDAAAQPGGLDAPQAVGAFFNGTFPQTPPGEASGWTTANAFPNLTFIDPLWLTPVPGTGDMLLVGKNGQLWRFANNPAVTQAQVVKALDWASKTQTAEDQGFYRIVFHPEFGQAGSPNANFAYVSYNCKPDLPEAGPNCSLWRVSRFTWQPATGTLDPNSEFVLMSQFDRDQWHNGGGLFFDTQGFLNIIGGDGGDSPGGGGRDGPDASLSRTQRLDFGLFSGVFRIDVSNNPTKSHSIRRQPQSPAAKPASWPVSFTQGYGIPNDNPWLDPGGGVLEEYFALGLRSPHTAHYDAPSGEIWIGDVGGAEREELSRLVKGDNAQWGYREGLAAGPGVAAVPPIGIDKPPVLDYGRSVGGCIIGGMRYRGSKWNGLLGGKVLYGDLLVGKIWAVTLDESGGNPVSQLIVEGFPTGQKAGLANFCTDAAGEIYLMNLNGTNQPGGTIRKLVLEGVASEPPALLSQTGVFTNLSTLAVATGVIPYSVANPLWSDGAAKKRWVILPNNGTHDTAAERITFSEEENWVFPAGTVFVKHFEVATNENIPSVVKRLETRFLVCTTGGGKYGLTYRWNAAGTDAELLAVGAGEDFTVTLKNGGTEARHWSYPSRGDCLQCHNSASGQALGVRTHSLNMDFYYAATGRTANQLATFNSLGMFDHALTPQELDDFIEARAIDDATAPVEHRVRSYLDSNCSHCHRPGGAVDYFDARLGTPLNAQGLINAMLKGHFDLGPDGRYLKPADPDLSALQVRMANVGNSAAMPPLAKNLVDQKAVDLLRGYLNGLIPAEFDTIPSPEARYVRLTSLSEVNGNTITSVAEFSVLDGNGSPIPQSVLSVHDVDSQELIDENGAASRAIDGDIGTYWHTEWGDPQPPPPHHLTIDLGSLRSVGGFVYTPRQGVPNGRIGNYQVHYSADGVNWTLMTSGTWTNDETVKIYNGLVAKRKARCQIAGPVGSVHGAFDVTVVFDKDVTDFTASDLQVSGGSVSKLRGKGYYYVATVSPVSGNVSVSVPADAVNASELGSRASSVLSVNYQDVTPPIPVFTGVPAQVNGPFQIGLEFGEAVTGLDASDFLVTNTTLNSIVASGTGYLLNFTPLLTGSVGVEIRSGAVRDTAALPMGAGTSVSIQYFQQILARNAAETSYLGGGMAIVTDAAAPHGKYLWLPDGAYPGNSSLPVKTQHRAEYTFNVPRAGQWLVRGLVRPPNTSSDTFWVEIDGNQALGTVSQWVLAPVGASYNWDYLNSRNVADPVTLTLTTGTHIVTIYGREDGARLDRLELESVRPLAVITTAKAVVDGPFTANLVFSASVTGLTASDFTITGGSVASVTGSGATYVLSVVPTSETVVLTLPHNAVVDSTGALNFYSNTLTVTWRNSFRQWAFDSGVSSTDASLLADEDGDGIGKLLEFAFHLDPAKADSATYDPAFHPGSGLPRMILTPGGLSLQFLRRKGVAGLSYRAQFGSRPDDFTDAVAAPAIEPIDADWELATIPDPAGADPVRRFGRVVVTMAVP